MAAFSTVFFMTQLERMSNSTTGNRIPSLDGIRAISILLVLYGHVSSTRDFPVSIVGKYGSWFGDVAHLGVLVFFVISGFLITSLLMREREATGTISLKRFYLRRVLRIFPAFYAFILVLAIAVWLGAIHLTARDFAFELTYTVNYVPNPPWRMGHLWSLSVEEQFYLLWPLTLLVLRKRRALIVAIAAIFAGPLVRVAIREWIFHVDSHSLGGMTKSFPAMFDYLATGCALALLRPWLLTRMLYLRLTASRWLVLAIPLVLLMNRMGNHTMAILLGSPVMNTCIALLIESGTRHAGSLAGRFLNWKPIVFLGVVSYSLYLWQQLFLDYQSRAWMDAFPQNLGFAFLAALASWFLVERPFLRLRKRLRNSTGLPVRMLGMANGELEFAEAMPTATNKR
ncbi:MAG TPA: acyltransferase [Rhodanobacteraceae bacterium]|jgi:peptidoglycan/LPS O-acetylase OafA/YrhL|nr:acyltransferase [Rhodanobacteraceae bacterium]